jgi:hypothetical protein
VHLQSFCQMLGKERKKIRPGKVQPVCLAKQPAKYENDRAYSHSPSAYTQMPSGYPSSISCSMPKNWLPPSTQTGIGNFPTVDEPICSFRSSSSKVPSLLLYTCCKLRLWITCMWQCVGKDKADSETLQCARFMCSRTPSLNSICLLEPSRRL